MTETNRNEIDLSTLVAKLNELQKQAEGDLARVIELLLLENHILSLGQSHGFNRGVAWDLSEIPRFLEMSDTGSAEGDLAQ